MPEYSNDSKSSRLKYFTAPKSGERYTKNIKKTHDYNTFFSY